MLSRLFGSGLRAKALGWLLTHPDERFFVQQLAGLLGEDRANLSRELARLERLGILTSERQGREKYFQANRDCPIFPELQGLAIKTSGLGDVLRSALEPLAARIEAAFVYGSVADGTPRPESDVDLMIIGEVAFAKVVAALAKAQGRLGREINPAVYPSGEFSRKAAAGHHFIRAVLNGPKIFVQGNQDDLDRLAQKPLADRT